MKRFLPCYPLDSDSYEVYKTSYSSYMAIFMKNAVPRPHRATEAHSATSSSKGIQSGKFATSQGDLGLL